MSETGVHPLDGDLFYLVLRNILVSAISTRENYAGLIFHAWYLHDGILAGPRSSLRNALALLQGLGPPLSLHVNIAKCEVLSNCSRDVSQQASCLTYIYLGDVS